MPLPDVSSGPTGASMLQWALYYASIGIRVFPCVGKVPTTPHGFHDATTDEALIRAYWERAPEGNIGGVPGPRYVVLDVDGSEGIATAEALGIFPPRTTSVITGGGGWHLWFRHPGGSIGNTFPFHGIDVRADAGYVILPPSIHPETGQQYFWDPLSGATEELPLGVRAQLTSTPRGRGATSQIPDVIPFGRRHNTLVSLAGALRRVGASGSVIIAALRGINKECIRPPLTEGEVEQIAHSVCRYDPVSDDPTRGGNRSVSRCYWEPPR